MNIHLIMNFFFSEVFLVSNWIFLPMDSRLCDFSVDTTCLCQTLVRPLSEVFIIKKPSYFEYILGKFFFFFFLKNRWPYPFLDLSSPYAPLWYVVLTIHLLLFRKKFVFMFPLTRKFV